MHPFRAVLSPLKPTRLGVLFAVLIGFGVGFWQWGRPPRPRVVLDTGPGPRAYFSPDGQTLVIVHGEDPYYLALWDVKTGTTKIDLGKIDLPEALAFSPNSETLACRSKDQIRVWDLATAKELATYKDKDGQNYRQMSYSTEGKLLALGKDFLLWDVAANKVIKKLVQDGNEKILEIGNDWLMILDKHSQIKVWDLTTATVVAESKNIPDPGQGDILANAELSLNRRFLFYHQYDAMLRLKSVFTYDLGNKHRQDLQGDWRSLPNAMASISPGGHTVALLVRNPLTPQQKSWWNWFTDWLGLQRNLPDLYIILKAFPSGEELAVLRNCSAPMFSPDGRTLAVHDIDGKTLELFDLPIRKPIGKILGLAALAAVATLLALNGLGWLRRRRIKTAGMSS
jgi:WD40 repeat protein